MTTAVTKTKSGLNSKPLDWSQLLQPGVFTNVPRYGKHRFYIKLNAYYIIESKNIERVYFKRNVCYVYTHLSAQGAIVGYEIVHNPETYTASVSNACLYITPKKVKSALLDMKKVSTDVKQVDKPTGLIITEFKTGSLLFVAKASKKLLVQWSS